MDTRKRNAILAINLTVIAAVFVLNYFYQMMGFDFTLKCICSGGFALLGVVNAVCVLKSSPTDRALYLWMAGGLVLAMLGDVIIKFSFVMGAAVFALGHVCFVIAFCFIERFRWSDTLIGGVIFSVGGSFLALSPMIDYGVPLFRWVCVGYAAIISLMLGKAVGNFCRKRTLTLAIIAVASLLFAFSDMMLVFDWFIGRWSWTDHACMGTYYPALCSLAFAVLLLSDPPKAAPVE